MWSFMLDIGVWWKENPNYRHSKFKTVLLNPWGEEGDSKRAVRLGRMWLLDDPLRRWSRIMHDHSSYGRRS